jgi:hypothetical protein
MINAAGRVSGRLHAEQGHKPRFFTVEDLLRALRLSEPNDRASVRVLNLSSTTITVEDIPTIAQILEQLPNLVELDLSGTLIGTTDPEDVRPLLQSASLKRMYVLKTAFRSFSAGELYKQLRPNELEKIIFLESPQLLRELVWTKFVTDPELQEAVLRAHNTLFMKFVKSFEPVTLPPPPAAAAATKARTGLFPGL